MCNKKWASAFAIAFLSLLLFPLAGAIICPSYGEVKHELGRRLSPSSSIHNTTTSAPRWSLYGAPSPAFVVNVASESDVAVTVGHDPYISYDGY